MIDLFRVYMPPEAGEKVVDTMYSGYIAEGENVRAFEKELGKFFNNPNVITTNSCTSAIHLALKLCNADVPDSYVMVTPMTCIASCVSIQNIGAEALWVDVDPNHGMLTAETIRSAWEKIIPLYRKNVKALIYVCWGGDLGPLPEVDKICKELGIPLIVDAAQAFGVRCNNGQNVLGDGTHGDYVCLSFQAIKAITTSDGGALLLRSKEGYSRAFNLKWFGIDREGFRTPNGEINWEADVSEIGFKFHMNNIAGCIGTEQMRDPGLVRRLNTYIANDVRMANELNIGGAIERSWRGPSASWVSTFICENTKELLDFLREKGIHASQMHVNNDIYTGFKNAEALSDLLGVKKFMESHICLPCGWWVSSEEVEYIAQSVKEFYGK